MAQSELQDGNMRCPEWVITGDDIYISGKYISDTFFNKYDLFFKIIKKTKDQFVIMSATPSIYDLYEEIVKKKF